MKKKFGFQTKKPNETEEIWFEGILIFKIDFH